MSKFFENKKNLIIIGIVVAATFLIASILVLTGKIDVRKIMGNTANEEKICPDGYQYKSKKDDTITCSKEVVVGDATPNYTCPSNYSKSGTKCNTSVKVDKVCPAGTTPNADGCISDAVKITKYRCSSGTANDAGYCIKEPLLRYVCSTGRKEGSICIISKEKQSVCQSGRLEYNNYMGRNICVKDGWFPSTCEAPYKKFGNTCYLEAQTSYKSCPSGYRDYSGTECASDATKIYDQCESGWGLNSQKKCQKGNDGTYYEYSCKGDSKAYKGQYQCITSKTCPSGSSQDGDGNCYKTTSIDATISSYSCSKGKLKGTKCVEEQIEYVYTTTIKHCGGFQQLVNGECVPIETACPPNHERVNGKCVKKTCENGYELKDGECVKKTCDTGYELKDGKCVKIESYSTGIVCGAMQKLVDGKCVPIETACPPNYEKVDGKCVLKKCDVGYELKDGKCVKKTCNTGYKLVDGNCIKIEENIKQCVNGYTLNGDTCYKKEVVSPRITYTCPEGYIRNENHCTRYEYKEPSSTLTCPIGYSKSGNKCYKTDTINASLKYTCPESYSLDNDTKTCKKTSTVDVSSTEYVCPEGYSSVKGTNKCIMVQVVGDKNKCAYTVVGNKCLKYDVVTTIKDSKCPPNYSLNGDKCVGTVTTTATKDYTCRDGYKLVGSKCTKNIEINAVANSTTCPSDYAYSNNRCVKTVTTTATETQKCDFDYKLVDSKCIKESSYKLN